MNQNTLESAADLIRTSDAMLITAGAGMGVDSGLPDFRGPEGFWRAYPALRGLRFEQMSTPSWFRADLSRAWGFFGHRLDLYRRTQPHAGFEILRKWIASKPRGGFVATSNVDGQFQKAGFDERSILEVHGTIHQIQCTAPCCESITPYDSWHPEIDEAEVRCLNESPKCLQCGAPARPNILMFNDRNWLSHHTDRQAGHFEQWLHDMSDCNWIVIELGAGTAVTTIRSLSESLDRPLIRINLRDSHGPEGCVSIPAGALDALTRLDELITNRR